MTEVHLSEKSPPLFLFPGPSGNELKFSAGLTLGLPLVAELHNVTDIQNIRIKVRVKAGNLHESTIKCRLSAWRQKGLTGYTVLSIKIDPFASELTRCVSNPVNQDHHAKSVQVKEY